MLALPCPSDSLEEKEMMAAVTASLRTVTARERRVLEMRFGLDGPKKTYREAGEVLGVSGGRVRQIEEKALRRLGNRFRQGAILAEHR